MGIQTPFLPLIKNFRKLNNSNLLNHFVRFTFFRSLSGILHEHHSSDYCGNDNDAVAQPHTPRRSAAPVASLRCLPGFRTCNMLRQTVWNHEI